ncbi:MAG: glycosyltransferase, partial [Chloroflexi bacterium]|nr:glycosyltransferase [Chloroflexota bacterium]
MRVLMLSKACIVGAYQRKLEEMAVLAPEMSLTVVVPPFWQDERGKLPLEKAHTEGYDLRVIPMLFNGSFHLHLYPTLGRVMREVQPDIVHIDEEPYNVATYHAHRLARRHGARALWFSWQNLQRRYPPPYAWMERYNLRHIDYALTGSQTAAQVWRQKGYDGPLAVIPQFGVDPQHFAPPPTPAPDERPTHIVHIIYVGRLVPEKGVDLLLTALAELEGAWRATILGRGPEAAKLRALTERLGLSERVAFRERLPSVEMPRFYQRADVLALPSRTRSNWMEQFGRVLIEAMACGVAVVGAESGEIPYVIGDAGLLCPEDDTA